MSCKDLQEAIALYADGDTLEENVRARVDTHLPTCPLCRARLAEFQTLQNDLRVLSRPAIPADLLNSVRSAVAVEVAASQKKQPFIYSEGFRRWLQFRFMPYAVGTVASLILTFSLLASLLSSQNPTVRNNLANADSGDVSFGSSQLLLAANSNPMIEELKMSQSEYAAKRVTVANESPSVNPTGALVALTKSIVRGKMRDDEVVVVADVFGNGMARISEVVEAPSNESDLQALENALQKDPNEAAFLPARFDNRSDVVRVVLKIQRVDVVEKVRTPKPKPKNR
ncbi:MAG: zf-HC2 domain-containing protein [Acidobacteriota bacterium]|nr:zf-HC2 domain-containing protein [Acidobacteriota bacterium]